MNNINPLILELKKQNLELQQELKELKDITNCILSNKDYSNVSFDEKHIQEVVKCRLTHTNNILQRYAIQVKKQKNNINKTDVLAPLISISDIINQIKSIEKDIVEAQIKCALNNDCKFADKLVKVSLELNYFNHKFTEKAGKEIKDLKEQNFEIIH
jgi:hypothetical protein